MTTKQILQTVSNAGKPIKIAQFYRLKAQLKIKPLAHRQRPQIYPEDTAKVILQFYGLAPTATAKVQRKTSGEVHSLAHIRKMAKTPIVL